MNTATGTLLARPCPARPILSNCKAALPVAFRRLHRRSAPQVRAEAGGEVLTDPASLYFVAMNNFKVIPEMGAAFEDRWKTRESHLKDTPGFKNFALLKCDVPGEYVSFSAWESRDHFEAWTKSQSFSKAHGTGEKGNESKRQEAQKIMAGPPTPKFYEAVTVTQC